MTSDSVDAAVARNELSARPPTPFRKAGKAGYAIRFGFLAMAAIAAIWGIERNPWLRDRRLSSMSLESLQHEIKAKPNDPDALYYTGLRLNQRGRYPEAAPLLQRAAEFAPEESRIRAEWMRSLLGCGHPTEAVEELTQFESMMPRSSVAHRLLGEFYVSQRSMLKANAELSQAVRLDPNDREAWIFLAAARVDVADPQGAIQAEQRAVALDSHHAGDHVYLGTLYERNSRWQEAGKEFQEAVRLDPHLAVGHSQYAQWLLTHNSEPGDLSRAESEARAAIRCDARDSLAQQTLGEALARCGKPAEALTSLEEAARLATDDPAPARRLIDLNIALGNRAEAARWQREYLTRQRFVTQRRNLVEAVEVHPNKSQAHAQLADLLARHGDVSGSIRQYAAALHALPDSAPVQAAAEKGLLAGGHVLPDSRHPIPDTHLSAESAYREAVWREESAIGPKHINPRVESLAKQAADLDPSNLTYLRYLLHIQVARRYHDQAIETAGRVLALSPSDAYAHTLLGILLLERASTPQALDAAESHLRAAPAPTSTLAATQHFGLGLLAMQRHQPKTAVTELKESLHLDPTADVAYYKLSFAETALGDTKAGAAYMSQYRQRQALKREEADLLGDIAQRPRDAATYIRAIAFFDRHGLHAQAQVIQVAEHKALGVAGNTMETGKLGN